MAISRRPPETTDFAIPEEPAGGPPEPLEFAHLLCPFNWPIWPAPCYIVAGFSAGHCSGTVGVTGVLVRMERALKHKFTVGETVYFTASNVARPAATGTYEVIRLLPTDGDDCQYRIKSSIEAFERVAKESQLAMS